VRRVGDERIGVVVLTHNRVDQLLEIVARLQALPEQPEIVVVDNGSRDGTAERLARCFPTARCVRSELNLGAAGRNLGVRACARRYVALCDDDTWWEGGSLRRAADLLDAHPRLGLVNARVLVGPQNRVDATCAAMARSPVPGPDWLPGRPLIGFLAGASAVRRRAFLEVGGFEPRLFIGAEEELVGMDLARNGWAMAYVEDLVVHHHPSPLRDPRGRSALLDRNRLWIAWMRRPVGRAVDLTVELARRAMHDPVARGALVEALRGLPWALGHRRVVPIWVEPQLRAVEHMAS